MAIKQARVVSGGSFMNYLLSPSDTPYFQYLDLSTVNERNFQHTVVIVLKEKDLRNYDTVPKV